MKRFVTLLPLALAACVDQGDVTAGPFDTEFILSENYQAVYARTVRAMRTCIKPGNDFIFASGGTAMDAQLYSDLKYGEIIHGLSGVNPITLGVTRIDAVGSRSKVSVKAPYGLPKARDSYRGWLEYWSRGGTECRKPGDIVLPQPPAL